MCVPEVLCMRTTARRWNDAGSRSVGMLLRALLRALLLHQEARSIEARVPKIVVANAVSSGIGDLQSFSCYSRSVCSPVSEGLQQYCEVSGARLCGEASSMMRSELVCSARYFPSCGDTLRFPPLSVIVSWVSERTGSFQFRVWVLVPHLEACGKCEL